MAWFAYEDSSKGAQTNGRITIGKKMLIIFIYRVRIITVDVSRHAKRWLRFMKYKAIILLLSLLALRCSLYYNTIDALHGEHIPKYVNECITTLDTLLADSTKQSIRAMSESEFGARAHFGLGLWIRNNWGLWRGSKLSYYFNQHGVYHPDYMSAIILAAYHRSLLREPIRLDDLFIGAKNAKEGDAQRNR